MDSTPSSSRCSSSTTSSAWPDEAPQSETPSTTSDVSSFSATRRVGLSKPFRSPLQRTQSSPHNLDQNTCSVSRAGTGASSPRPAAGPLSVRKQREPLETRLVMLRQASKCLREDALNELPKETARWCEAGQLAAQDLWRMTGAQGGDWSTAAGASTREDYGLESPPSTQSHKCKAQDSQESPEPPLLLRRSRISSPGAEEESAALRSTQESAGRSIDPLRRAQGENSQGALSETSLPDVSELLRRSQSVFGSSSTRRQQQSLLGTQLQESEPSPAAAVPAGSMAIERKWNIGSMLDMLGADKSTLAWDPEEEDFRDPGAN
ncbi:uncharacterized protein UBRO_05784 [Ustilago bromivora]|uniref:Uncharacterized protein n=1 Tax=Ustilago bromivora TaxID=307758 RepID=A0A1K0HC89_9BASI|nr:uncharacterized protein UBRO_05784 [Ustilago bromivora]SYW77932.1 uncharacterized protein UBRO2_02124 [Ustilago bromivora]